MKFALVLFVVCVFAASVQAQTDEPITTYDDTDDLDDYSPSSYDYSTDSIPSDPTYPEIYLYLDDDLTTPKPFKQQFLSLLFNKKAG